MISLSLSQAAKILNIGYTGPDVTFTGLSTDSRNTQPGHLFLTWAGEQHDGHIFCADAVKNGAAALMVNHPLELDVPQLIVTDTIKALGELSAYWRSQFDIPVIGVTGSNGKTTVKNMLASIMQAAVGVGHYLAPKKSFNNFVGVPLTLAVLSPDHQYAVIEMGMNHFDELNYLTQLTKPNVVVITNAGPSHLEGVGGTIEGVAKAKAEIMSGLSENGTVVLNADDDYFDYWVKLAGGKKVVSFALKNTSADVTVKKLTVDLKGSHFALISPQGEIDIQLPLLGEHNVMNALAACTSALSVGINLSAIQSGLATVVPEPHRLELKTTKNAGIVLDDSYNANPNSVRKAIDMLKQFSGTRVLVLGDMRELGPSEKKLHEEIGGYAKEAGIEYLFTVGDLTRYCVNHFNANGRHFRMKRPLIEHLKKISTKDHVFLVKGSLSMGMTEVVNAIIK